MLNGESTSISREREEETDEYKNVDISAIRYSKSNLIIDGLKYEVSKQKATYYQGRYYVDFKGNSYDAYTINNLKGKIAKDIKYGWV